MAKHCYSFFAMKRFLLLLLTTFFLSSGSRRFPFSLMCCNAFTYLCKTKETFKLAELQFLETTLQAKDNNYNVTKLLIDQATGSTLFRLESDLPLLQPPSTAKSSSSLLLLPTSLSRRCDWIAHILHGGTDALAMVEKVRRYEDEEEEANPAGTADDDDDTTGTTIKAMWSMDYIRMQQRISNNEKKKEMAIQSKKLSSTIKYTKSTILQSVSQALKQPPALDPNKSKQHLLVVDTVMDDGDSSSNKNKNNNNNDDTCFLTQVIWRHQSKDTTANTNTNNMTSQEKIMENWSKRPFQYSSAINRNVAEIIMDILLSDSPSLPPSSLHQEEKEEGQRQQQQQQQQQLTLLDPTCGSGTFLALAIGRNNMKVEGYDCNPGCVDGTKRNLEFLFGKEKVNDPDIVNIQVHDSSKGLLSLKGGEGGGGGGKIDFVVANLPWGVNTMIVDDDAPKQNERILQSVRARIDEGIKCAFVTRQSDMDIFTNTGYEILGQAYVPQREFILPKGKKKSNSKDLNRNGRDHCVVTIARSC